MTRSDLIAVLAASNSSLRQSDAELVVSAVFDHIIHALANGGRFELRGFGSFTMAAAQSAHRTQSANR
jgi:integration host factor subunit beta